MKEGRDFLEEVDMACDNLLEREGPQTRTRTTAAPLERPGVWSASLAHQMCAREPAGPLGPLVPEEPPVQTLQHYFPMKLHTQPQRKLTRVEAAHPTTLKLHPVPTPRTHRALGIHLFILAQ